MRAWKMAAVLVAVGGMTVSALAQGQPGRGGDRGERPRQPGGPGGPGGGGMRQVLSPEKAKAAWELQARSVAKSLGLDDAKTSAVVKAYGAARESHNAALEKMREEMRGRGRDDDAGGRRGLQEMQEAMEALNEKERGKLKDALAKTLSKEQVEKAMVPLGMFNRQWDVIADTIAGFNLDSAKQQRAMEATRAFVVAQAEARDTDDREAMREQMQEARQELMDTMKGLLSEEQFGRFQAATMGGRGMRGPGGEGGDRPGRGGGREGGERPGRGGERPGRGGGGGR